MLRNIILTALFICKIYCYINPPYLYREQWFLNVPIDHFAYSDSRTFSMRYLINDTFFKHKNGPIFFYCGNEGDITLFVENTGFMWDVAPDFNAMLIFAEHRYYGETLPFGNDSFSNLHNLGKLTTSQTIADYVTFIQWFKNSTDNLHSPVIAFGGSYGGELAAWMRIKYPHIVAGAFASSAPILMFTGIRNCSAYSAVVTQTFKNSGVNCASTIRKSWSIIFYLYETEAGRKRLNDIFRLCKSSYIETFDDAWKLVYWLLYAYGNLAMMDYPYPTDFTNPVPAWPVKEACKFLDNPMADNYTVLSNIHKAVSVYLNFTGQTECFSLNSTTTRKINLRGWFFQTCTELVIPMCQNGITDMFQPFPWDFKGFSDQCFKDRGVRPREHWATMEYGGENLRAASNIIFSNGNLDPWSAGGVNEPVVGAPTLTPIFIENAAHHYDLRGYDPRDTKEVLEARTKEIEILSGWLNVEAAPVIKGYFQPYGAKSQLLKDDSWLYENEDTAESYFFF